MARRGSDDPNENRESEKIRDKARYEEGARKGVENRTPKEPETDPKK